MQVRAHEGLAARYGDVASREAAGVDHLHGGATFFRVGFHGPLFEAQAGREYVYRTPAGTSLVRPRPRGPGGVYVRACGPSNPFPYPPTRSSLGLDGGGAAAGAEKRGAGLEARGQQPFP